MCCTLDAAVAQPLLTSDDGSDQWKLSIGLYIKDFFIPCLQYWRETTFACLLHLAGQGRRNRGRRVTCTPPPLVEKEALHAFVDSTPPLGSIKWSHYPSKCIKLFITKSNNA